MSLARSMMSDWKVELVEDNINEFFVEFPGPKDSAYGNCFRKRHRVLLCSS